MFSNSDTALFPSLVPSSSLAETLLHYRDHTHRARCVVAANRAVEALAAGDIKALIFGALTQPEEQFTHRAGIDLCIVDDPVFHRHSGPLFHEIQDTLLEAAQGQRIDFVFLSCLTPEMAQHILRTGRPRVE